MPSIFEEARRTERLFAWDTKVYLLNLVLLADVLRFEQLCGYHLLHWSVSCEVFSRLSALAAPEISILFGKLLLALDAVEGRTIRAHHDLTLDHLPAHSARAEFSLHFLLVGLHLAIFLSFDYY